MKDSWSSVSLLLFLVYFIQIPLHFLLLLFWQLNQQEDRLTFRDKFKIFSKQFTFNWPLFWKNDFYFERSVWGWCCYGYREVERVNDVAGWRAARLWGTVYLDLCEVQQPLPIGCFHRPIKLHLQGAQVAKRLSLDMHLMENTRSHLDWWGSRRTVNVFRLTWKVKSSRLPMSSVFFIATSPITWPLKEVGPDVEILSGYQMKGYRAFYIQNT